jgi:hypothetical protein
MCCPGLPLPSRYRITDSQEDFAEEMRIVRATASAVIDKRNKIVAKKRNKHIQVVCTCASKLYPRLLYGARRAMARYIYLAPVSLTATRP